MVKRHDDHNSAAQKINGRYPGFSDGLGCIHTSKIRLFAPVLNPILAIRYLFTKQGRFVSALYGCRMGRKMQTCPSQALQVLLLIQRYVPATAF